MIRERVKGTSTFLVKTYFMTVYLFVSRVGLVSKCVDQGDVELIRFDKEFLFLLLQASFCH